MSEQKEKKVDKPKNIERWVLIWSKREYGIEYSVIQHKEFTDELDMLKYGLYSIEPTPFRFSRGYYVIVYNGKVLPRGYPDPHRRKMELEGERKKREYAKANATV